MATTLSSAHPPACTLVLRGAAKSRNLSPLCLIEGSKCKAPGQYAGFGVTLDQAAIQLGISSFDLMTWLFWCLLCQLPLLTRLVTPRHDAANVCHRIRSTATLSLITSTIETLEMFEHRDAVSL